MFGLVVLGVPSIAIFRTHSLTDLMKRKFQITFRQPNGESRVEECYCSPSNDHCKEGEYSVLIQLDRPMIHLDIFVVVNEASGEGRITSSRPRSGEVNPWLLLETPRPPI